jgi:hypothetical protein
MQLQELFDDYVQANKSESLDLNGFIEYAAERGVTLVSPYAYDQPITGLDGPKAFYDLAANCKHGGVEEHGHDEFYLNPQ